MRRALISVTDKTGVVEFAQGLIAQGFEIVSTGGTARVLGEAGVTVVPIEDVTGFPEMMDGRLKTLHPMVHGGLLARRDHPDHMEAMHSHGIGAIDVLAVNLYAFEATVSGEHEFSEAIESIDIGGPTMIRAAAKNGDQVWVVVDPQDYERVLSAVGAGNDQLKSELRAKAFRHTAFYDGLIADYLTAEPFRAETRSFPFRVAATLRYGENPHQAAALLRDPLNPGGIAHARQLWGKELSYNNLLDGDAAWSLACELPKNACVIVKHGNPCGAAWDPNAEISFRYAREADPISAFGGIVAFHGMVDTDVAQALTEKGNFFEVILAEDFTADAAAMFEHKSGWGQNVRLLATPANPSGGAQIRSIGGGALWQSVDEKSYSEWNCVTDVKPESNLDEALKRAWTVVKFVKSNAIVVCDGQGLWGVGAGQMNRVQSVRLATEQAKVRAQGAVLASDAFFPFPDNIEAAAAAGIRAIVQPGGSKRDHEVIEAANQHGLAMIFTGTRHFRH